MKSCRTCKWSRWYLTPTKRIKKDEAGRCLAPLPVVVLPSCVPSPVWNRQAIWPSDGEECPAWKENLGELIPDGIG